MGREKQIQLSPPVGGQPEPAGAEKLQGCLEENFVEGFPGVKIQKKGVFQLPGELRGIRSQLREEKLMAVDGSRKVPHILADFLRQAFIFHEKTFQGPFLKFRMRLQKPVQAVHIRLQVPGVVEEQSLRIDMRLQGVIEIREGQKLKGIILDHGITSPHHNA